MNNDKNTMLAEQPREWSGWGRVIAQALDNRGLELRSSPLAGRLLPRLGEAEVMDQTACNLLWEEAERISGDPWLGLHAECTEADLPLPLQMIGLTVTASLNMSAAVNNLVRFFALVSA